MTKAATKTTTQSKPYDKGTATIKVGSAAPENQVTFDSSSTQKRREMLAGVAEFTCTFDGSDVFLFLRTKGNEYRLVVIKNNGEILEPSGTIVFEHDSFKSFKSWRADILDLSINDEFEGHQFLVTKDNWNSFDVMSPRNRPVEFSFLITCRYGCDTLLQHFWAFFEQPCNPTTDIPRVLQAMLTYHKADTEEYTITSSMSEFILDFVAQDYVCTEHSITMLKAACDLHLAEIDEALEKGCQYIESPKKTLKMWMQRDELSKEVSRALVRKFRCSIYWLESPDELYSLLKEEELTVEDLTELFIDYK